MDLLKFMYTNKLSATTPTEVLYVLMAANKFEVESCMRYCSLFLQKLNMTTESALVYLSIPFNESMANAVWPLTDAAKQFLARRYRNITRFQEEVLRLPLWGIEVVLSSDNLHIASEDDVYNFAVKWARMHYPSLVERRKVWTSHLCYVIRFPYRLKLSTSKHLISSVIYLDLTRDECASLCRDGRVYSQAFRLGRQGFSLSAHCERDQQNAVQCFGLYLGMQEKGLESLAVDFKFAVRISPDGEYAIQHT
ncbi:hypothetical protein CQW23_00019 [Capsicum baccatum]|uniref:BTB/POZ domain-containing protein POB1 n=1 Tax=Capsicum baccatum TaxID=33114 RepID=A0A2G2XJI3_CAPBA|nr:hypothetical protein CQW23_00019 [Capsicum baccatum]